MQTTGEGTHVTSLSWMQEGNYLAVGTSDHKVRLTLAPARALTLA